MKKLMISAVTLLPLIILLILSVSTVVVSLTTYIYVENIEFVNDRVFIQKPDDNAVEKKLEVNVFPLKANNKELAFWSENEEIAVVDNEGFVTAKNFGEVLIYAKSKENEAKIASCKITVTDDKIHNISIVNPIDRINLGDSYSLTTEFSPKEAKNVRLNFSSSDTSICEVSPSGVLTANSLKTGKAIITVKSEGNPAAFIAFEISVVVPVKNISISNNAPIETGVDTYVFPEIEVSPSNADVELQYWVDNDDIATINQLGEVKFKQAGSIEISAKAVGCDVVLKKKVLYTGGYFTGVSFNHTKLEIDFEKDKQLDLVSYCTPTNGNRDNLEYEFSNLGVVYENDGKIFIEGGGIVTITAKVKTNGNGGFATASCNVKVNRYADELAFYNTAEQKTNYLFVKDKQVLLNTKVLPADCTDKTVSFSSNDSAIATVDESGKVTFLSNNYSVAVITAAVNDGKGGVIKNSITVVYVGKNVTAIPLTQGNNEKAFIMPSSDKTQEIVFVPYFDLGVVNTVEYAVNGENFEYKNNYFYVKDKGNCNLTVKVDGETYSTLNISAYRKIESITFDSITSKWSGETRLENTSADIYTSAKTVEFAYSSYPINTSVALANVRVDGDAAYLQNNQLIFTKPGKVKLSISADGIICEKYIESTFGLFDDKTTINESITVNKGSIITVDDVLNVISPYNADTRNIEFISSDTSVLSYDTGIIVLNPENLAINQRLIAEKGGNAEISVKIKTKSGTITKKVDVKVCEQPTKINLSQNYIYINTPTLNIKDFYKVYPSSANVDTDISASLIFGAEYVSYTNNVIAFTEAGLAEINLKTGNNIATTLTIIYTGNNTVLADVSEVEINKPFIYKIDYNALNQVALNPPNENIPVGSRFIASANITVKNGCIFTLTEATASGNANASVALGQIVTPIKGIIKAESVKLTLKEEEVQAEGETFVTALGEVTLNTSILPANATYKDLTFKTSDDIFASVSDGKLKFKKSGTVRVTVSDKFGTSSSVTVRSTFGALENIVGEDSIILNYDNNVLGNNQYSILDYVTAYPKTANISVTNVKLIAEHNALTIDGLNFTLEKGGEFKLIVQIKKNDVFVNVKTISVKVNRAPTSIILNGNNIQEINSVIQLHSASNRINFEAYPSDANVNVDIVGSLISGAEYASFDKNRLLFVTANQEVTLRFTIDDKSWDIKYITDKITQSIDIDPETLIVPANEWFTFYSNLGTDISGYTFSSDNVLIENEGINYRIVQGGKGILKINDGINNFSKTLVITYPQENISGVKINDVDKNNQSVALSINKNDLHYTASKTMSITADLLTNTNIDGLPSSYVFSVSDEAIAVANSDGVITFSKAGIVTVTVSVRGEDYFGEYNLSYSFRIASSYGFVSDFDVANPYPDGIIVDEISSFSLDGCATVKAPSYGVVTPLYEYTSSDNSVITVASNGDCTVVGTGLVDITIKTKDADGNYIVKTLKNIRVDKFIDNIKFNTYKGFADRIYVKNDYEISLDLSANGAISPTLTAVKYEVISGNVTVSQSGLVDFIDENCKCQIKVSAVKGGAYSLLTIIKVGNYVNIEKVENTTGRIVLETGKQYVFDMYFDNSHSLEIGGLAFIETKNVDCGIVKALYGGEANVAITNSTQTITVVVTENVESISLKADEVGDNYLTAKGADGLNLSELYGASFLPLTARDLNGAIQIKYELQNITGEGYVSDGILYVTKAGKLKVTIKAGDKSIDRIIESTLGYAKSVKFNSSDYVFEYIDGQYIIKSSDYTVLPSDATLANVRFETRTESDADVLTIENNILKFVGGGNVVLYLVYDTALNTSASHYANVSVINRAKAVSVQHNGIDVNYIVVAENFKIIPQILFDGRQLSQYEIVFTSLNSVATVTAEGNVVFLEYDKSAQIKIEVKNKYDNIIDAFMELTLKCTTSTKIFEVTNDSSEVLECDETAVIYPVPQNLCSSYTYQIIEGDNVITLTGDVISVLKGGFAKVKILGVDDTAVNWTKTINIFVHKSTQSIEIGKEGFNGNNLLTANTTIDLGLSLLPIDSNFNKQIVYQYDKTIADVSENGIITFKKAGILTLVIKVLYGEVEESTKTLTIDSTYGKPRDFVVKTSGSIAQAQYALQNVGDSIIFEIGNFEPIDYSGEFIVSTNNSAAHQIIVSGTTVTVKGIGKGTGIISINCGGLIKNIEVDVLLKASDIKFSIGVSNFDSIKTLNNVVTLKGEVYPLEASNKTIIWSINNGAVIDGGNITLPVGQYGDYIITAKSADGAVTKNITVSYLQDIAGFTVKNAGVPIENDARLSLAWNIAHLDLEICLSPESLVGSFDYSLIQFSSINGSTATYDGSKYITVSTPSIDTLPVFSDTLTLTYKSLNFTLYINRDGIKSVEFIGHDNGQDKDHGLQEIRMFGNKTSYDGATVSYYKMSVLVEPLISADNIVWTSSSSLVGVSYADGYAKISFGTFAGSSETDIENDIFDKTVTVTAKNSVGEVLDSYTFHIINNAVNVFDFTGFNKNGRVVLHNNFGTTEDGGNTVMLSKDITNNKSFVYGNGYTINYENYFTNAFNNNTDNSIKDFGLNIGLAYNVTLKGQNNKSDSAYAGRFGVRRAVYTTIKNSYRLWIGSSSAPALYKNILFSSMKHCGLQIANTPMDVYLEDSLFFNTGYVAIDYQSATDDNSTVGLRLKGFFDVYNYKTKDQMGDLLVGMQIAMFATIEREYPKYLVKYNKTLYFNSTLFSGKDHGKKRKLFFYQNGEYIAQDDGTEQSATGLKRLLPFTLLPYSYWAYIEPVPDNTTSAISPVEASPFWIQFKEENGELVQNNAALANQEQRLKRNYGK